MLHPLHRMPFNSSFRTGPSKILKYIEQDFLKVTHDFSFAFQKSGYEMFMYVRIVTISLYANTAVTS